MLQILQKIQILIIYPCVKTTYHAVLISEAIAHSTVSDLELFLPKILLLVIFGTKPSVSVSMEVPGYLHIRKNWRVIQLFKYLMWVNIEPSFFTKILISAVFEDEIKIHVSNEVTGASKIKGKTTRDIQSTSKMDQNRLKYINTFQGVYNQPKDLIKMFSSTSNLWRSSCHFLPKNSF